MNNTSYVNHNEFSSKCMYMNWKEEYNYDMMIQLSNENILQK